MGLQTGRHDLALQPSHNRGYGQHRLAKNEKGFAKSKPDKPLQ